MVRKLNWRVRPLGSYSSLKRILDLVMSALLILFLSPLILAICLAIWVVDGPPIVFVQNRTGENAKPFAMLKFRTMGQSRSHRKPNRHQAEPGSESHLTRLGGFLRTTSADELPQLLNIIAGHMSFVGPRPLLTEYLDHYDARQNRRHDVKPGLTGLAQVLGRNNLDFSQKLNLDLRYVDNISLQLDFWIVMRTFTVLGRRGGIDADDVKSLRPPSWS